MQEANTIYANDDNKVAKFYAVPHTGYVIIFKWIYTSQSWAKYGKILIDSCPFFLRRLFDYKNPKREFIGIYSDTQGIKNVYEWR